MQATRVVKQVRRTAVGVNALGQPVYDSTLVDRRVFGWQPTSAQERNTAALAGRTVTEIALFAPDGDWSPDDEVIIGDQLYAVSGEPEDYNTGPFTHTEHRWVVNLRKVAH